MLAISYSSRKVSRFVFARFSLGVAMGRNEVPMSFNVKPYKGKDDRRKKTYVRKLENARIMAAFVDRVMTDKHRKVFTAHDLAAGTGIMQRDVETILLEHEGSQNITVFNPEIDPLA